MAITNASRVADFGSGIGTEGAVLQVDNTNERIGIGTTNPQAMLQVGTAVTVYGNSGIVSATQYYGDGSELTGITAGATLSAGSGAQRVVVTSLTSGTMTTAATDGDLTWNSGTNTLAATNITGALTGNASGTAGGLSGTPDITVQNITGVAATFSGVVTYEDVTNIDSVGIVTAGKGLRATTGGLLVTAGVSTFNDDVTFTGSAYNVVWDKSDNGLEFLDGARATFGTGSDLILQHTSSQSRIDETSGNGLEIGSIQVTITPNGGGEKMAEFNANGAAELYYDNSKKLETTGGGVIVTGVCTATSFSGDGSALTGISAGISTAAGTSAGIVTTLYLSDAQDHKMTASGVTTITCSGGTEGDSHTLRITNSGITTIGFSTYFLWPSGSAPSMPTVSGAISLISFTVQRVGTAGTQLLAGASLNFSY